MGGLFSTPDIPEQKPVQMPPAAKQDDSTSENAANAERIRRLKALSKQKSIFAGELGTTPTRTLG